MRKLFGFVASVAVVVGFAHPVSASETHDDYCAQGTFDTNNGATVVCEDDYPCEVTLAKTHTGECWTERGYGRHF